MLGFTPSLEWWARQGLNLRPHPCEGLFSAMNGGIASTDRGTDHDSSANEAGLSDHGLTSWEPRFASVTVAMALGDQRQPRRVEQCAADWGWVYFIQAHCGAIKIGRAKDVRYRIKELQCANPRKLELLAVTLDGRREADYHRQFAAHRLHGEWFAPHPDILAEIERLNASPFPPDPLPAAGLLDEAGNVTPAGRCSIARRSSCSRS
jgi:hypothetical protein